MANSVIFKNIFHIFYLYLFGVLAQNSAINIASFTEIMRQRTTIRSNGQKFSQKLLVFVCDNFPISPKIFLGYTSRQCLKMIPKTLFFLKKKTLVFNISPKIGLHMPLIPQILHSYFLFSSNFIRFF